MWTLTSLLFFLNFLLPPGNGRMKPNLIHPYMQDAQDLNFARLTSEKINKRNVIIKISSFS